MKVYIDRNKVKDMMCKHKIRTFTRLARDAGIDDIHYLRVVLARRISSLSLAYLLCDYFECRLDDVCSVDWGSDK